MNPRALVVVALAAVCACSGDEDTGQSATGSCEEAGDCPSYVCSCKDGTTQDLFAHVCIGNTCTTGDDSCGKFCSQRGGLEGFTVQPNVVGTPECDAFCKAAEAGGCPCQPYESCSLLDSPCEAEKRARLACQAESGGKVSCGSGFGVEIESDCPTNASLCGDAGS